jgi:hypothetical protein
MIRLLLCLVLVTLAACGGDAADLDASGSVMDMASDAGDVD